MRDTALENHRAWLGLLQPVGLVVSPHALVQAQALLDQNLGDLPIRFKSLLQESPDGGCLLPSANHRALFTELLQWRSSDLIPVSNEDALFSMYLSDYQETVSAQYIVKSKPTDAEPMLLIFDRDNQHDFDTMENGGDGWQASPHAKAERLLREKNIPIGIILNQIALRIIYAPKGESSGYVTFPFHLMNVVAGRSVLAAFKMLLGSERLFSLPTKERLPGLLSESRQYQNVVSTKLAEQVLAALYEFLRGLQGANERRQGILLKEVLGSRPNDVYHASITTLMRMVFVLFAEDRDLIPASAVYTKSYSIKGLFERLREDDARYHDTMDQRYGAWAQLLVLFRILYDGVESKDIAIPARHGHLFDPVRFPFLEGRIDADSIDPPLVADGVIFRVLSNLMLLDGERISYRALDVEQIGSVYETVMGFQLEITTGISVAMKPKKSHGAPIHIDLEILLSKKGTERKKFLKAISDQEVSGDAIVKASNIEEIEAALERRISRVATPNAVSKGSLILQPSDARRKSGSHYTPRSLTEPIVRKALEPLLVNLGENPTPDEILELKVCDPAMGSGAFLVEATRQLSEILTISWEKHKSRPKKSADEDNLLNARRLVAQRCIYGIDKNPMAVDLAKLSLWLATCAKNHAFTFLDHVIKTGDSLVGFSLDQISGLSWESNLNRGLRDRAIRELVREYFQTRNDIGNATASQSYDDLVELNQKADAAIINIRFVADSMINAWFSETSDRERKRKLEEVEIAAANILANRSIIKHAQALPEGLSSFHWQLEFPEVFQRKNGGFDAIIGNPPYLGGKKISGTFGTNYLSFIKNANPGCGGQCDLVVYFLRKGIDLTRANGTLSLVVTNSVSQGDSRISGLGYIYKKSLASIYASTKRLKWPGEAAVVVSIIHLVRQEIESANLDGKLVSGISPFLVEARADYREPERLNASSNLVFKGVEPYAHGFFFDDSDPLATPTSEAYLMLDSDKSHSPIRPILGGEDLLDMPVLYGRRFIIDLCDMDEKLAARWPRLLEICKNKVLPERSRLPAEVRNIPPWQFWRSRREMRSSISRIQRFLAHPFTSTHLAFRFVEKHFLVLTPHIVVSEESYSFFSLVQSRSHEIWARFFASSLKDDLRYTPSDCFETFPFPKNYESDPKLESAGKEYYEFRDALMIENSEGLTKTYNRFHDPDEASTGILKLRELHAIMDRKVLDAYGWEDIKTDYDFLLDFEGDDEEPENGGRRRRKPWRYRWPDNIRDEVLARLLDLNAKRADEESIAGTTSTKVSKAGKKKDPGKKKKTN